jgi:hypothetical protein
MLGPSQPTSLYLSISLSRYLSISLSLYLTIYQVAALERAVDACAEDSACLQGMTAEADARREADGPLVV